MKRVLATFLCVTTIGFVGAPCAWALDPVDALFADDATPIVDEAAATSPRTDSLRAVRNNAATVGESAMTTSAAPSGWHTVGAPAGVDELSADAITVPSQAGNESPGRVSPVPEPSAIILALAALAYFLLFGRRRRIA